MTPTSTPDDSNSGRLRLYFQLLVRATANIIWNCLALMGTIFFDSDRSQHRVFVTTLPITTSRIDSSIECVVCVCIIFAKPGNVQRWLIGRHRTRTGSFVHFRFSVTVIDRLPSPFSPPCLHTYQPDREIARFQCAEIVVYRCGWFTRWKTPFARPLAVRRVARAKILRRCHR